MRIFSLLLMLASAFSLCAGCDAEPEQANPKNAQAEVNQALAEVIDRRLLIGILESSIYSAESRRIWENQPALYLPVSEITSALDLDSDLSNQERIDRIKTVLAALPAGGPGFGACCCTSADDLVRFSPSKKPKLQAKGQQMNDDGIALAQNGTSWLCTSSGPIPAWPFSISHPSSCAKLVFVDYHGPKRTNPLRYLMRPVLHWLEPFALDLWRTELPDYLPDHIRPEQVRSEFYCGGLYQKVVVSC